MKDSEGRVYQKAAPLNTVTVEGDSAQEYPFNEYKNQGIKQ
jgi:hypothetical protein